MHTPRRSILALVFLAACSDHAEPTLLSPEGGSPAATATERIPTRAEEDPTGWTSLSDDAMWAYVAKTDSTMVVGLRAPGTPRGVWRNQLLVSPSQWRNAHKAVVSQPGVTLLEADTRRPAIRIKVAGPGTIAAVRKLPVVDYAEPTHIDAVGTGWASDCGDNSTPWPGTTTVAGGDIVHPSFKAMGLEMAWKRSNGAGVTIGLIDTGLSINQPEFMMLDSSDGFTSGESGGRFVDTNSGYDASCSHGTRMAGVIAAPKNGRQAVGIAWKSNLVSYHHADDVWGLSYAINGHLSALGIRYAADRGAKVMSLAFQTSANHSYLADEIRWWYYSSDILFVGAAGTGNGFRHNNVLFPAELAEVFAVTGVDYGNPDDPCSECFYGTKVALASYIYQATEGMQARRVTDINGSSVATAVIAGVAALLYSRHPGISRAAVVDKLQRSGHRYSNRSPTIGYGVVNGMKALGGLYNAGAGPGEDIMAPTGGSVSHTVGIAVSTGDTPGTLEYSWNFATSSNPNATFEFEGPPYGEMVEYVLYWSVRDLSDGNVISGTKNIRVWGCSYHSGAC